MGPTPKFNIDPADWLVLSRLLDIALELPLDQRAQWLDNLGPEYAAVKDRLREILSRAWQPEALIGTLGGFSLDSLGDSDSGSPSEGPGDIVGPYCLVRELGKGGMGTVWLAERVDGMINRPVALKLPRGSWTAALSERMARERIAPVSRRHGSRSSRTCASGGAPGSETLERARHR
jgi:serine/threonine-protein kinase